MLSIGDNFFIFLYWKKNLNVMSYLLNLRMLSGLSILFPAVHAYTRLVSEDTRMIVLYCLSYFTVDVDVE